MRRCSAVALVAISLVVAGCGDSTTTSRSAAGVRADYRTLVHLLANGEGQRACAAYVSRAFKAALKTDKRESCASVLESGWKSEHTTANHVMAAITTVQVNGDHATIRTRTGSQSLVYATGHWQDSPRYEIIVTDPDSARFSITRDPDGSTTRRCHPVGEGGCSPAGTW